MKSRITTKQPKTHQISYTCTQGKSYSFPTSKEMIPEEVNYEEIYARHVRLMKSGGLCKEIRVDVLKG